MREGRLQLYTEMQIPRLIRSSLNLKVLLVTGVILVSTIGMTFYVLGKRHERLLLEQMKTPARILFRQVVLTRRWIADHGGIFVEKLPWVKRNPYLKDGEIVDIEGRRYVKENPAYVTRELSEYSKREGIYWFHITSLNLVNPANAPDDFEREALRRFEAEGLEELTTIERVEGVQYFRYIAPLYVEPPCLECHRGYRIGDIRGAISVTIPVNNLFTHIDENRRDMLVATFVISAVLLLALFLSLRRMVITPVSRLREAIEDFSRGRAVPDSRLQTVEDEIGALYRAFTEMRETIDRYQEGLRERIKEATEELQQSNRRLVEASRQYKELSNRKSEFITNISHELRTPLTAIKGAIDYISTKLSRLKDEAVDSGVDDVFTFLGIIRSNAERLVRMVNDTLDIEKIESGRVKFHFAELELGHVIDDVIAETVPLLDDKGIVVSKDVEEGLYILADEDRIRQVLLNLITNAVQHSPEGSEIGVEGYLTGDWVVVRITDRGPGIKPEEQKRVFEKFYKGSPGGTGLGLAISKSIVEGHRGEIGVVSDGVNGSIFYFKLPALRVRDGEADTCRR